MLFGIAFLGTALSLALGWDLLTVAICGSVAGLYSIVIGVRLINLNLTKSPIMAGIGFILPGLAALLIAPAFLFRKQRFLRILGAVVLLVSAAIWAMTGYDAIWEHIASFAQWLPVTMK